MPVGFKSRFLVDDDIDIISFFSNLLANLIKFFVSCLNVSLLKFLLRNFSNETALRSKVIDTYDEEGRELGSDYFPTIFVKVLGVSSFN